MTAKHERKGPGGRPRDANIPPNSRAARGRTLADAPITRGGQLIVLMREMDVHFGMRLAEFNDELTLTDAERMLLTIAPRYVRVNGFGKADTAKTPVRGEVPYTAGQLAQIRAGVDPDAA